MRLSILYIDTEAVWRGGQEQLFGLMTGLKHRGHQICLASPPGSPLAVRAEASGIHTLSFRQRSEISPIALGRLLRLVQTKHFDILHLNTPRSVIVGGIVAKLTGIKGTVNSRRVNFPLRTRFSRWKYNLLVDCILTVSVSIQETLVQAGVKRDRVETIYEGVSLDWIDSLPLPSLGTRPSGLVIGTVAHLSQEKGHVDILYAAARLKENFPTCQFWFIGDGPLRGELEGLVNQLGLSQNIVFLGFRTDSEALMKQFDIFCMPSLSEGLSSAILAAMANRLPVVATTVGGIPELVVEGVTGYLVPPSSPEHLAEALNVLLHDKDLRQRFGDEGRARIAGAFTVKQKLNATEAAYLELLHSKGIG